MTVSAEPFSVARMRASLYLFAAGKIASGLIGVVWLLMLVRLLNVSHYAGYIVMMALLEITMLVSNAGVFPFAQRYITEARLPHNLRLLPALVWRSLAYRIGTLAVAAGLMGWHADLLASLVSQPQLAHLLVLYGFVIVFEGSARYLELTFESLLEQGRAQLCALLRNGTRLGCVFTLSQIQGSVTLADIIKIESITSGLGLLLAIAIMANGLSTFRRNAPHTDGPADSFSLRRLTPFALPLFVAQCLTQLYSPDTIKLIVSRLLGIAEAATFGFAHALSYVLQRYLPANLLIGLIRPMLVARRARQGSDADLHIVGNVILKINLFLLLPLAALFTVAGREFAALASGGRYAEAGPLLVLMTLLLALNGLHVVLSMLATALEDRRAVLLGTLVSVPGILVGIALAPHWGAMAMVIGLWLSELLWCSFTLWLLKTRGFAFDIDRAAWFKLALSSAIAAGAAAGLTHVMATHGSVHLLLSSAVIAVIYPIACLLMAPLSAAEQTMLFRLLPARWRR